MVLPVDEQHGHSTSALSAMIGGSAGAAGMAPQRVCDDCFVRRNNKQSADAVLDGDTHPEVGEPK